MNECRTVTLPVDEILSLVNCAEDYGHASDVFLDAMAEWAGDVTQKEIIAYANGFLTPDMKVKGYSYEDRDNAIDKLTRWREQYVVPKIKRANESR